MHNDPNRFVVVSFTWHHKQPPKISVPIQLHYPNQICLFIRTSPIELVAVRARFTFACAACAQSTNHEIVVVSSRRPFHHLSALDGVKRGWSIGKGSMSSTVQNSARILATSKSLVDAQRKTPKNGM